MFSIKVRLQTSKIKLFKKKTKNKANDENFYMQRKKVGIENKIKQI